MKPAPLRSASLDALRGFAIVMMVLSATIAAWVLPAWMFHAQEPPPSLQFDPSVYGITWVDLVFPFFLFAMGAAFPFSVGSKLAKGENPLRLLGDAAWRFVQLAYFALFLMHVYPHMISNPQDPFAWWIALGSFALLFPMFMRWPWTMPQWARWAIQWGAFLAGFWLMWWLDTRSGGSFNLYKSNIIILLLANMALFGTAIYIFTWRSPMARIAVLPILMGLILSARTEGSWQEVMFNWTPAPWLYKFMYLKYLFIVIPGTLAGEYVKQWLSERALHLGAGRDEGRVLFALLTLACCVAIVALNLWGLFTRHLFANFAVSGALCVVAFFFATRVEGHSRMLCAMLRAGGYLLMLGLCFEAFEGGIRKDDSTFSYYFVTSGLAFFSMAAFAIMLDIYNWHTLFAPLTMPGKNPMIAYVATNLFTYPVLNLLGLGKSLTALYAGPWLGFLHGVILTSIAILVAMFFTRIKWFWRT